MILKDTTTVKSSSLEFLKITPQELKSKILEIRSASLEKEKNLENKAKLN